MKFRLISFLASCILALSLFNVPIYAANLETYPLSPKEEVIHDYNSRVLGMGTLYRLSESTQLRKKADDDSTILVSLSKGDSIWVIKSCGSWKKAYAKGKTGYVLASCIEKAGP